MTTTKPRTLLDRITAVALDELKSTRILIQDGLRSGAYLYPFNGIFYLITHRSLWQPLLSTLAPTLTLSIIVTTSMFILTYIPQTAILAFTSGPFAPFSAALLVLSESSSIVNFLARSYIVHDSLTDTFDGTLLARGDTTLVGQGRVLNAPRHGSSDPISRLGRMMKRGMGGEKGMLTMWLRSLLYLPLNFIPVVGNMLYLAGQGKRRGSLALSRYFELKGWNAHERDEWLKNNRAATTSFGAAAFILEIVPFASLVLAYSNTVGAALWASNLEKSMITNPSLQSKPKKAE